MANKCHLTIVIESEDARLKDFCTFQEENIKKGDANTSLAHFFFPDLYDGSCDNSREEIEKRWGPKWDIGDVELEYSDSKVVLKGITPWGAPGYGLQEISRILDACTIDMKYWIFESGVEGSMLFVDGEIKEDTRKQIDFD